MKTNGLFFDELQVSDITVISGARPYGRTVDHTVQGRRDSGFLFVWRGETTFAVAGGSVLTVGDGMLAYLPKHAMYHMKYTAESTTFVVVNFEMHDREGREVLLFPEITSLDRDDASHRIANTMMSFELCSASRTADAILRKKELLYRLLGSIYASGETPTGEGIAPQIAQGVRLLEQSYLENLPITQLAAACHVSVNTFRSLFRRQFGTSPIKYRNRLRIERARELLTEGGFTVSEIAYASGFENVGYFCRYYRQVTGETPGETRRRCRPEELR